MASLVVSDKCEPEVTGLAWARRWLAVEIKVDTSADKRARTFVDPNSIVVQQQLDHHFNCCQVIASDLL
jgi:hypothetical protein